MIRIASLEEEASALEAAQEIVGGKWKTFILHQLAQDTQRFGELRKAIPAITQKVLAQILRELESSGIVSRQAFGGMPPRVDYALTEHGRTLIPILHALIEWGQHHQTYQVNETALTALAEAEAMRAARPAPVSLLSEEELTEAVRAAAM